MSTSPVGLAVRLKRDLTRYHPSLVKGAEGTTQPPLGRSMLAQARYLRVRFGEVVTDILWADLEVIDPRWVEWQDREKALLAEALRDHVAHATLKIGERGGFRELVVEYNHGRTTDRWKRLAEARPIIEDLRKRGALKEEKVDS